MSTRPIHQWKRQTQLCRFWLESQLNCISQILLGLVVEDGLGRPSSQSVEKNLVGLEGCFVWAVLGCRKMSTVWLSRTPEEDRQKKIGHHLNQAILIIWSNKTIWIELTDGFPHAYAAINDQWNDTLARSVPVFKRFVINDIWFYILRLSQRKSSMASL